MTEGDSTRSTAEILEIMAALPHRYPFLMIDRIIEINGGESCIGVKNVTINEPHFQGHFPSNPVMPGVLLIEGMAQTAGALCIMAADAGHAKLVYFLTIDNAKFRHPVVPGDVVHFHVKRLHNRRSIWKYSAEAIVDEKKVAEAVVCAMMADPPSA